VTGTFKKRLIHEIKFKEKDVWLNTHLMYDKKLYIEMLLADAESFARAQNIFKPESFDRKLQPIAKFVKDYMDKYMGHARRGTGQRQARCQT
jgi:hypothetical protein